MTNEEKLEQLKKTIIKLQPENGEINIRISFLNQHISNIHIQPEFNLNDNFLQKVREQSLT